MSRRRPLKSLHAWDLLLVGAAGVVAGTLLCAVGLLAAVLLTAFVVWDVWPLRSLDLQDLRAVLALGTCVGVWFTLSKEGRSEWWR